MERGSSHVTVWEKNIPGRENIKGKGLDIETSESSRTGKEANMAKMKQ